MSEITLKTKWTVFLEWIDLLTRKKKDYTKKEILNFIKLVNSQKINFYLNQNELVETKTEIDEEWNETNVEIATGEFENKVLISGSVKDIVKTLELFLNKDILDNERELNKVLKNIITEEDVAVKWNNIVVGDIKFKNVNVKIDEETWVADNNKIFKLLDSLNTVTYEFIASLFEVEVNEETGKIISIEAVTLFDLDKETEKIKKFNIKKNDKEKAKLKTFFEDLIGERNFNKIFK